MLVSCASTPAKPVITFLGVGSGTLTSQLESVTFTDRFDPKQRGLIAVVGFRDTHDGMPVEATWFSPDDRRMPLGRTTILLASGANIARFSIASTVDWQKAPYMLQVYARSGEGEEAQVASGSLSFFMGLSEKEIEDYRKEYAAWKVEEAEIIRKAQEEAEKKEASGSGANLQDL